ncbi:MAG: phosphonate C-P lyase system protein PhnH [Oscillospiraceae bacterium]|nr:phosphonate C-P lyase system protein PhnH [Oscillospiraceae bacterium]
MTLQLTKKHNFDVVFDSQKIFRLILEAMSNPTRIVNISKYGDDSVFLTVAMTLLDNEVSFNTCGNETLSEEISSLTLAKRESLEYADFIFASDINCIENVKCGTLADPHKSATVIIRNDGEPACQLTFEGPGINDRAMVQVTQIVYDAVTLRDAQNYEYPQGIDLIFVSGAGELFAIPRLVKAVQ